MDKAVRVSNLIVGLWTSSGDPNVGRFRLQHGQSWAVLPSMASERRAVLRHQSVGIGFKGESIPVVHGVDYRRHFPAAKQKLKEDVACVAQTPK
jgi:hypothetical protein